MYTYTIIYHKRVKFVNKNMLMGNKNVTFLAFTKRTHRLHKTVAICVLFSVRFIPNRVWGIRVGDTALAAIMDRGVLCSLYGNRIWLCGQQHPYL